MKRSFFLSGLIVFICIVSMKISPGQYYLSGQDPASVRWNQINTENFQVIFPEGNEKQAQYIANILDTVYSINSQNLEVNPKKISLVLHVHAVTSNAFVGWAPKRIEFFNVPPQDSYPQEWYQQLGLHEFRHVQQISKVNQGLTKILSYILGQQGTIAIVGLYVPFWFLEGDAVFTETFHSHSGRGRDPAFTMPLRAQLIEKDIYSYDKASLGSFKDYIPNHYILGYHLVASGYQQYLPGLWNQPLNKTGRNPYMVVPFASGIKNITGLSKTDFYCQALTGLKTQWEIIRDPQQESLRTYITPDFSRVFTNYRQPCLIDDSTVVAIRSSLNDITRIVTIDKNGKELKIKSPGIIFRDNLSYADGNLCWAEKDFDPRWSNREYSNIYLFDYRSKKQKKLTRKSRYFVPELSHDGSKIATVEVSEVNEYSLIIIDTQSGKVLKKITTANNYFIQHPSWSEDDGMIVMVLLGDEGKAIAIYDFISDQIKPKTEFSYIDISQPVIYHDTIYYIGPYNGINNIYAFIPDKDVVYQVTSSGFGAFDPVVISGGNSLLYADYNSSGYKIMSQPIKPGYWKQVNATQFHNINPFPIIDDTSRKILDGESIPGTSHEVKRYNRLTHLFNFHSWSPFYLDVNKEDLKPGLAIFSQNKLSTAITTLGWEYDRNEKTGKTVMNFTYMGWYPVIDIKADFGRRKRINIDSAGIIHPYRYYQTRLEAGITLPLRFTYNQYFAGIRPGVSLTQFFLSRDKSADSTIDARNFTSLNYKFYLYNQIKTSLRDLQPRWGQVLNIGYSDLPFENGDVSSITYAEFILYFPGILRHHGLRAYAGAEIRNTDKFFFGSEVSYPRGFNQLFYDELYSFKIDYRFPVVYPDFSLLSILYLKRIKAGLFYDYAIGIDKNDTDYFRSMGLDIRADLHIIRFVAPFDLGLRTMYLPDRNKLAFEFLFAIDFDALYY